MVSDASRMVVVDLEAAVLILVLMEYGLWREDGRIGRRPFDVLILVLMEYGLWPHPSAVVTVNVTS